MVPNKDELQRCFEIGKAGTDFIILNIDFDKKIPDNYFSKSSLKKVILYKY